ncbi:DsbA family oxidoreductase [Sphingomonas sp. OTU376]|uniref:DsbA family oxidoreductase n=1 Tax=Sphingomonas sp. OTU376 TaxID=3043863 RepID=UPI00313C2A49
MTEPVKITVTSDFICPWCHIGEQRLAKAIAGLPGQVAVDLIWLPFELNPDMPAEGMDRKAYRSRKFGSWERSRALDAGTEEAGAVDDVPFDYDAMTRTPSSLLAHRLSLLARREDKQTAFVRAVFRAYFAEGGDIGDPGLLAVIAAEVGLEGSAVERLLASDELGLEVRALEHFAADRGVRGVPFFEIGGRVLEGAQPVEVLRDAILAAARAADPSAAAIRKEQSDD